MRNGSVLWIALLIILLIDLYVFFATRSLISISSNRNRLLYTFIYWAVSLLALATTLSLPYLQFSEQHSLLKSTLIALIFALCLGKIIAALFFFVDDIRRGVQWLAGRAFSTNNEISEVSGATENAITRSSFLSWLGVIAGGGLFSTFIYGLTNKYNYQIKQMKLSFENLPASFKGLKIIQISDIHSGSFTNYKAVNKGVDMILNQ
ncbi:MAG TPA: metallophosphoesterase, partial [Niabella sp.]|nr:metallophosphoesterase [Niabella sp.]